MAYFLKKNIKNGKTYLSIVNSYYDSKKGCTAHTTYESYGSVESLISKGIEDPIGYCEKLVKELNKNKKSDEALKISNESPLKYGGYFLAKAVLNKLKVKKIIDVYDLTVDYKFKLYDVLCSLIFSRMIKPCSKYKTFNEVIPYLDETYSFSYDQLLEALEYYGDNYERIVEIFYKLFKEKYKSNTDITYFDCTNYYFEIDKEDEFRRKGPGKENRPLPLVGMGLLLDSNQIPIGMKLYPGNVSEKPILRKVISDLKTKSEIKGKTIQVADKGLNCAINIEEAKKNGDGYLFSKSVKQLPETEKVWVLLENDYQDVLDKDGNILYRYKSTVDEFPYNYIDESNRKHKLNFKEKRLVTYNPSLAIKQKIEIDKLVEKAKSLCLSKAKKDEYGECAKYVSFKSTSKGKTVDDKVIAELNTESIEKAKMFAGYNLLVTSEIDMTDKQMYDTYHNLWRIEESFRVMKSELDARPVYLQKENTIKGHFLICYLATVIIRILQIHELEDNDSYQELFKFIRDFKFTKYENKYINMATKTDFLLKVMEKTDLPLDCAILSANQYKKIMNYEL